MNARFLFLPLCLLLSSGDVLADYASNYRVSHDSHLAMIQEQIEAMSRREVKAAKNVMMIMVDGLDLPTLSLARALGDRISVFRENRTSFVLDKFVTGIMKAHSYDFMAADVAAATSAYFNGVHERNGQMGWEEQKENNCTQYDPSLKRYQNLFNVLNDAGRRTGLATNAGLTSPGVAGTYGESPDAMLETDAHMVESGCQDSEVGDLAKQLITHYPFLNVVIGTGMNYFVRENVIDEETGLPFPDSRSDMDLIWSWKIHKMFNYADHIVAENLTHIDRPYDYLLGLLRDEPSFEDALTYGSENMNINNSTEGGFFAIYTDIVQKEHKQNKALQAAQNLLKIMTALDTAMETGIINTNDTLVLLLPVTGSDMHFSGENSFYHELFSDNVLTDTCVKMPPVNYMTGPPAVSGTLLGMEDQFPSFYDSDAMLTSSGSDLPVFALGPSDRLFSGLYDRPYIYHAILSAMCVGEAENSTMCMSQTTTTTPTPTTTTTTTTTTQPTTPNQVTSSPTTAPPNQPPNQPPSQPQTNNQNRLQLLYNYWLSLQRNSANNPASNPYGSVQTPNTQPNTNPNSNQNPASVPNTNPVAAPSNTNPAAAPNANPQTFPSTNQQTGFGNYYAPWLWASLLNFK